MIQKNLSRWVFSSLFFFGASAFAGDKIGNGGGVWACQDPQLEIYDIHFMDVFEARREYKLTLPETNLAPLEKVQEVKAWIAKSLAQYNKINQHIDYVEKNITWIQDVLTTIPDAANKTIPHPSTCKQGQWAAVQLVNFTDDFRILVRQDIFDSAYMSSLERAAVYLHEGVYSFMRTEYGDTNSVRSRAIVGALLSSLPTDEKVAFIDKQIHQQQPDPTEPVNSGWICGLRPSRYSTLYLGEGVTEQKATDAAIATCVKAETPNIPGVPPGMPMPWPGPGNECQASKVLCEAFTAGAKKKECTLIRNNKSFRGTGRTTLEAQKEAVTQCLAQTNDTFCNSVDDMTCK